MTQYSNRINFYFHYLLVFCLVLIWLWSFVCFRFLFDDDLFDFIKQTTEENGTSQVFHWRERVLDVSGDIHDAHHYEENHHEKVNPGVGQVQVTIMVKNEYYRCQQADLCCAVKIEHLSLDNI